jgi:hypothetical protein
MGWRADCIGRPNLTYEMLPPKVEKMGEIWKKGHVSFEAYWWLGEWKRQGWDLDKNHANASFVARKYVQRKILANSLGVER